MATKQSRIDGHEIVDSGIMIARMGSKIELHPFPDDAFPVYVDIVVLDDKDFDLNDVDFELVPSTKPVALTVKLLRKWDKGSPEVYTDIRIGASGKRTYYLNVWLDLFGSKNEYFFSFGYSIYLEAVNV